MWLQKHIFENGFVTTRMAVLCTYKKSTFFLKGKYVYVSVHDKHRPYGGSLLSKSLFLYFGIDVQTAVDKKRLQLEQQKFNLEKVQLNLERVQLADEIKIKRVQFNFEMFEKRDNYKKENPNVSSDELNNIQYQVSPLRSSAGYFSTVFQQSCLKIARGR